MEAGRFTRTYDALDQVSQLIWPTGDVLIWTYDAVGNRATRKTEEGRTTYTYNATSLLTKLVNEHGEVTTLSYDAASQETVKELDNGTSTTIIYDAAGQQLSVANLFADNSLISRFTYSYDPAENRTGQTRDDGEVRIWSYDPTNQLVGENRSDDLTTVVTTYVYDPVGNRLVLDVDGALTTSIYNSGNQIVSAEDSSGITTYSYDPNGNQKQIEAPNSDLTTYTWSVENQLAQVEQPDNTLTTYAYAPVTKQSDELRVSKESETDTTNYIWDQENIIREVDELGSVEAEFSYNPQPYGNLVSQHRAADSSYYHYDALGSTQSLTDQSATVENEYTYEPFGKELTSTGTTENPYTWVGQLGYFKDEASGGYSIRRRVYNEITGRWRSKDPIGFEAGDENLYRYIGNGPWDGFDPSGRVKIDCLCSKSTVTPTGHLSADVNTDYKWRTTVKPSGLSIKETCTERCKTFGYEYTGKYRKTGAGPDTDQKHAERVIAANQRRRLEEQLLAQATEEVINKTVKPHTELGMVLNFDGSVRV